MKRLGRHKVPPASSSKEKSSFQFTVTRRIYVDKAHSSLSLSPSSSAHASVCLPQLHFLGCQESKKPLAAVRQG